MPGGTKEGYDAIEKIVTKVAAQVDDGPCVTYVGPGAAHPPYEASTVTCVLSARLPSL